MKRHSLVIFMINFILAFIFKLPYRTMVQAFNLHDFVIFGSLPSFFYTVGFVFFMFYFYGTNNLKSAYNQIFYITLGCITYEFIQPLIHMTFDIKDVLATILGGLFSLILYRYIVKKHKINTNAQS